MLKKTEGIEQSRRRARFNSHSNSYSSANSQRIRIDINSSEEYIDFANSYICYDLAVTGATAQVGLCKYTASSVIKEIRLKDRAGNMIGENIQDYSVLARLAFEMNTNDEAEKSYLDATEGALGVDLSATTSIASRQYTHQIVTGVFASKNYFPAHLLGGLSVEIDMNSALDVVMEDGAAAVYTINNLAFVCSLVKLKPQIETMVLNQVQQGGLVVDYVSQHCVKASVNTNTTQRHDLGTLNGRVKSVQAVQILTKADQSVDANNSFSRNNTSNYRWKLGNRFLSESQVEVGAAKQAEWMMEWLKSQKALCQKDVSQFGNSNHSLANLAGSAATGGKFVIGQGADRSQSDSVLSSLKDKDFNRLELELNYSSTPTACTLYVFAEVDKRMRIFPGKQHQDDDFSGQGTNMQ